MGFLRLPKSMSRKRVGAADPEKTPKLEDGGRSASRPAASSLDARFHIPRRADRDVLGPDQRRLSDESSRDSCGSRASSVSSTASRVSFIDDVTPCHVVTEIRYRPRTNDDEKRRLFYSSLDFDVFEKEELCEQIEDKIREMERGPWDETLDVEIQDLVLRAQRNCSYR